MSWSWARLAPAAAEVGVADAPPDRGRVEESGAGHDGILPPGTRPPENGVDWSRPGAATLLDRRSAQVPCREEDELARLLAAAERAVLSPDALADEAELTARGAPLP